MLFRASRSGQYTGILVLRQYLKIEQTITHGYQPLAFWSSSMYLSWLIASRRSLYSISSHFLLIPLYISIVFHPISSLSLSRSFENHRLGCLINFLDVVFFFPSAPLFLQLLCLRTYFALSKALLLPDNIVAHRLLRRPHNGASASPTFTLGWRCGYIFGAIRAEFLMTNRFLFYLSLPQLWRTRIHLYLSLSFRQLICYYCSLSDTRRLFLDRLTFRLFRMWARPVPLHAIKPLNSWVHLG